MAQVKLLVSTTKIKRLNEKGVSNLIVDNQKSHNP
jgi:hypothetical protein